LVEDIPDHGAASRVYPLSANITTAAFHAGYFTSACGLTIYEGTALPPEYRGNSFTCEPAGNLVHRDVIKPQGVTFVASRAFPTNEFLASPDNWFRPVNLANGPDGALYVCDMYRKTIEHPEYLPEATRKITDFESGKDMGRIYRIVAKDTSNVRRKSSPQLGRMSAKQLVTQLSNSNVWVRMTAQRLLLERHDHEAVKPLTRLAEKAKTPETRVHALRTLEALNGLSDEQIERALLDNHPGVREHAIQLAEPRAAGSPALSSRLIRLAVDPNPRVRFQCALSLGELRSDIIPALAQIITQNASDKWTRAAVLSAVNHQEEQFLHAMLAVIAETNSESFSPLMSDLGRLLASASLPSDRSASLGELLEPSKLSDIPWQIAAIGGFGDGLRSRTAGSGAHYSLLDLCKDSSKRTRLNAVLKCASELAVDPSANLNARLPAINVLGQTDFSSAGSTLVLLIDPQQPSEIQSAAIRALGQMADTSVGPALVKRARWNAYSPAVRDTVLGTLMGNTNFINSLLSAVEAGDVPAWTVNADRRSLLMKHKEESIRARATVLFKDMQPGDRMKAYEESKAALALNPNPKNGHAVFQKNCTPCHTFSGEGKIVGPDLTGIRNQPREVLLLHIVVPEYEIMPIYTCYNVETKDAQAFTGLLASESASSITLRMAQGVEQQIPRSNIASMTTSRLSLMPQELEKTMTKQELADLIGFLKGD
jgi:putative heme-binding domain-containing protein